MSFNPGGGPPRGGGGMAGGVGGGGGKKHRHDDEEQGKLFVGGLSWDTTQDSLLGYFGRFGEVIDCVVMKNSETGRSRGFGFVTFSDPNNIDAVIASCPHTLDGRTIDPKACNPRSMQKPKKAAVAQQFPKVFLGGLPSSITETDLRCFFNRYGEVVEVVIMYDQEKKKSRGFGFLSFADEAGCARAVSEHFVNIQNKQVEIKRAEPRTHQGGGDSKDLQDLQPEQWAMGPPPPGPVNGHHQQQQHQQPMGPVPPPQHQQQHMAAPPHYGGWGAPAAPQQQQVHPATAYPPQYANPPVTHAPGVPPGAPPPQWASGPPPQQQQPAPHWGQPHGYASPPPPGQVVPQAHPTQYPGAVYPPPSTPQPPPQNYYLGPPQAPPPQHGPPADVYLHQPMPSAQAPPKVEYYGAPPSAPAGYPAAYSQYQPPGGPPPPQVKPAPAAAYPSASYEYPTNPNIAYPGPADLSGQLGPQRGAVYGTQPSPYHPYRRT